MHGILIRHTFKTIRKIVKHTDTMCFSNKQCKKLQKALTIA